MFGNCRHYSLYLDEDLVGRMKWLSFILYENVFWEKSSFSLLTRALRRVIAHTHVRTVSVDGVNALNHYAMSVALRWVGKDALLTTRL